MTVESCSGVKYQQPDALKAGNRGHGSPPPMSEKATPPMDLRQAECKSSSIQSEAFTLSATSGESHFVQISGLLFRKYIILMGQNQVDVAKQLKSRDAPKNLDALFQRKMKQTNKLVSC
ncbi:hypothetical protein [Sinorhizobium americanum]|uniref:hypothetical protein n=1 Tax=Sinorhizobium americanum TaxID=194963 RepID=UPI001051045A|nr:hypothetical protein [Sinorhizobium americanum]